MLRSWLSSSEDWTGSLSSAANRNKPSVPLARNVIGGSARSASVFPVLDTLGFHPRKSRWVYLRNSPICGVAKAIHAGLIDDSPRVTNQKVGRRIVRFMTRNVGTGM